ncbi:queuosine precursor transporter [Pelagibacterium limicola]|uniref:queuosine precursor transporter n=1 Tax=Pelagibacterium limicola TaxID=2791022 RepID=UPI0018AF8768|nr:queuosine precursor transporter [Pelagibacterium limicola]
MGARFALAVMAMAVVVTASNFLVQFPLQAQIGALDLAEILTWGAFTYPVAFLVNDLTNRHFGPAATRRVVLVGFALAVAMSIFLASPRIAIASGTAFLVAQTLDTAIFHRLRAASWWKAPLVSSTIGSVIDTLLFFGIAFAASFAFLDTGLGYEDSSLAFPVPFLSVFGFETPLWVSLAAGDLLVKILVALALLAPYRVLRSIIPDRAMANPA